LSCRAIVLHHPFHIWLFVYRERRMRTMLSGMTWILFSPWSSKGECSGKLHGTWDTCLVEDAVSTAINQTASDLIDGITPEMITKWSASDPRDWANDSFAIAQAAKTHYYEMHASTCDKPGGNVQISSDYLKASP
jgi:hypothetical protein